MKTNKNYEFCPSTGGFYSARFIEDGCVYWVQNDLPNCLTKSKIDGDNTFMEENIIYSIDTETENLPSKHDLKIYKKLFRILKDNDVILD